MVKFLRKVSDSEQQQKRTAYTKDKLLWMWFFSIVPIRGTLAGNCMGIVFLPASQRQKIMVVYIVETGWFLGWHLFLGMLRRPSVGKSQKSYDRARYQEEGAWHLPSCTMAGCPHSGHRQMSNFQTAFKSSAIVIPAKRCLNRWPFWSLNITFRFLCFIRLFRKP